MSLFAIGLLLVAAVLHTTWNLLLKQAEKIYRHMVERDHGFLAFTPAIYFFGFPSQMVWHILIISALLEISYYMCWERAYRDSDSPRLSDGTRRGAGTDCSVGRGFFLHERFTLGG